LTEAVAHEVPFSRPDFDAAEARAVAQVLESGWVTQGPVVARFEEQFAAFVGARYAVATSSCTTALHVALLLAGVGPGDEVICPSLTFIATANAIVYAGATPVFADVERDTWNIDPEDALRRVSPKTRAIMPVHQVGLAANLDGFAAAEARGLAILEDAACAIGATYRGRRIGSHGHITCFSFHPRKTLSTAEGGMITTDDADIAAHARTLRSHGASVSDLSRYSTKGLVFEEYHELGFNYRMSDVHAAIGLAQMPKLDARLALRRAIADRYDAAFKGLPAVRVPAHPAYAGHAYQSYGLFLTADCRQERNDVLRALVDRGISCRRGIPAAHLEPLYVNRFGRATLPVTEEVSKQSLFLPMYASLDEDDQRRVIDAVIDVVGQP
jgi:dTDP-4-amino-4,6-dideoxygalactose transaminase